MVILDTHVWVWWVHGDARLTAAQADAILESASSGVGVSAISCWEVAKLVERQKLKLPHPVGLWLREALGYPGVRLLELTPEVAVASTLLPGDFHRDPADQIIVASARLHGCRLVTSDQKILDYEHVETVA